MFMYVEKSTKVIIVSIVAVVIILTSGCLIAFHTVFHYNPDKSEFAIYTISENFQGKTVITLEGKTLTYFRGKEYTAGERSGIEKTTELTDGEVREVFRYIVKKKMYFLIIRDFNKIIIVKWKESQNDELMLSAPPTNYYIIVKYNNMEKTLGGYEARRYSKMADMLKYMKQLAEDKLRPLTY